MPPSFQPSSPERIPAPAPERQPGIEQAPARRFESVPGPQAEPVPQVAAPSPVAGGTAAPSPDLQRTVERVLEEGLSDLYQKLDPAAQAKFRHEGEVTAVRVTELLKEVSVKVVELMRLIRRWLFMLPGVSSLFVEGQAKLKAEKLLRLKR